MGFDSVFNTSQTNAFGRGERKQFDSDGISDKEGKRIKKVKGYTTRFVFVVLDFPTLFEKMDFGFGLGKQTALNTATVFSFL